ncbi:MAG TPA: DUF262 domain-containing protein [Solirubrobacterales bacterium]
MNDTNEPSAIEEVEELEPEVEGEPLEVEETEGDEDAELYPGVAPPDRRLVTQPYDLSVGDLVSQVQDGSLTLNPVYQRRYVWDNKKASKLVESLLINVPIPVCYLAEEHDGSRATIDGQQRLRSLYRFLGNEFPLRGLEVLNELNGKRFQQLTERQQRLIKNRTIRCIVISEDSDPEIRFDVFERLNTGSVALTAQELRNSVYRGPFNQLLHEIASSSFFLDCVGGRSDTRMAFEELILRFFALDDQLREYRPSFKRFLNNYQRSHRHEEASWLEAKRQRAEATFERVHAVFGDECFRRARLLEDDTWEWFSSLNSAMYDVVMLNFARLDVSPKDLISQKDEIEQLTADLSLNHERFINAISLATGDRTRVFDRVRIYAEVLSKRGLASGLEDLSPADE